MKGREIDLITDAISSESVSECEWSNTQRSTRDPCSSQPCHYTATCENIDLHDFYCHCAPGFAGRTCDLYTGSLFCF